MRINELCREAFEIASEKGWWDKDRNPLEILMLITSELAEAAEEFRNPGYPVYYNADDETDENGVTRKKIKPEGWLTELADAMIRIGDYVGKTGLSDQFEAVIKEKMEYNRSRPHRHGGKKY